ncbi:TrmB family transcriptional regulator [Candidatus Woesearchaeota archaeon]|nr:TrmB family transcriptional regulator [Candidatus Woesearchaeota archaeon]
MIVSEELLSQLRRYFGLNLYEVKIWTALLSRGVSTAGELSDIANVPRSRAYDILESLEKKGFIVSKIGKPIKYIAISPEEVIERVKKNMKKEAEERVKALDKLKETEILEELKTLHSQGIELVDPTELAGHLRGRHNLYNHIELVLREAEKTVTIMTTSQGFLRKVEGFKPVFEELKKRGVKIRIAAPMTKETEKAAKELEGIAEVRHTNIKARFILVDGEQLIFMVMDDQEVHPTYDIGIWVNTKLFASALENLFELAWKEMKPVIKTTRTAKTKTSKKKK